MKNPKRPTKSQLRTSGYYSEQHYQPMLGIRLGGPHIRLSESREAYLWLKSQPSAARAIFELIREKLHGSKEK